MSLISSNGGKTSAPDKTVKERILNQQIESLRDLHRQSFEAFDKIVLTLKKLINFKTDYLDKPRNQVEIKNAFLQSLSSLEESFLNLIGDFESYQELYTCTAVFRPTDKKFQNSVFRKTMKSYEEFKEKLNSQIHRLERDIQLLQSNGYHIYTSSVKPNNVLNSLKKANLDKFLTGVAYVQKILQLIRKSPPEYFVEETDCNLKKANQYGKILKSIYWKQQARQQVLIQQIEKCKCAFAKQSHKIKVAEEAIKKAKGLKEHFKTKIRLHGYENQIPVNQLKSYLRTIKDKVDETYILTPHLFKMSRGRSKSCNTVFLRGMPLKSEQDGGQISQYTHILASDFLQESVIV